MRRDEGCASEEDISSYLGGLFSEEHLATIEAHLDACSACARVAVEAARTDGDGPAHARRERPRIFDVDQLIAGRYRVVAFLGAGGMGEVYEAHDEELGETIALKTVSAATTFDVRAV